MDQNPPKESRPPINLRIKFRSESVEQFIERYAVDVSRGGIFIRTREPLAVGTQLKLDFQFQNGTALMAGDGTVVWIREFDANRTNVPPGMGVRFDKLTPESQAVLEQLLVEKAKRERSGIPGSSNQGGGGIAVRRPSSMFSVLDPQGPGAGTSALPATTGAASAAPAPSSEAPSGPLAAVAAQLGSGSRSGPHPSAAPSAAGTSGAASGATANTTSTASGEQTEKRDAPAYRPLGTARNPFSSVGPLPADGNSGGSSTGTATTTAVVTGAENRNKDATDKPAGATDSPGESSEDSAAPFGDINDEPTQIAGRLPSFLLSDEEATVTAGQVPKLSSEAPKSTAASATADVGKATTAAPADKGAAEDSGSGSRRPLPGMGRVDKADKRDNKKDNKNGKLSSSPTESASESKAGNGPPLSLAVPAAASTAGSAAGAPAASSATGASEKSSDELASSASSPSSTATGGGRVTSTSTPVVPPPPAAAGVENRRSGALWIGVMVVVLGAAGIFLFRFFSARTTDTGPSMGTNAAGISGAPPTSADPTPAAPAAVEPLPAPAAAVAADGAAGSAVGDPTAPGAPGGGAPVGQGSIPQGSPPAPSAAAQGAARADDAVAQPPAATAESGTAAPTTTRRTKVKSGRAARQSGAAGDTAAVPGAAETGSTERKGEQKPADPRPAETGATPAGGAVIAAPSAATVAAGPPAPAGNPAAGGEPASDGPTHQIRVTSKPDGAEVVLDGQTVGKTPFTVGIADVSAPHFIAVRKEGFEPYEQMFSASSGWSKGKAPKGKAGPGTQSLKVLKINAKLKPLAGAEVKTTTDSGSPANPGAPGEAATKGQSQPIRPDRPMAPAPSDERPATETAP